MNQKYDANELECMGSAVACNQPSEVGTEFTEKDSKEDKKEMNESPGLAGLEININKLFGCGG